MRVTHGGKLKYKIFDIHAHIAPSTDDGASNLNMSMEMIRSAYKQGVRKIVCTSHDYCDVEQYHKNFELLKRKVKKENLDIEVYPGLEIYGSMYGIDSIIEDLKNHNLLTINNTRYVLIEFHQQTDANTIVYCAQKLKRNGYNMVLAHVERYSNLFAKPIWLAALRYLGVLFQVNAYSLNDEANEKIKRRARNMLRDKEISFVGSDAHRTDHRPYAICNGIDYIYNNCDPEYAQNICYKNAERLFNIN